MNNSGERYVPGNKGQIEVEHLIRYYFIVNQLDLKDKVVLDLASGEGYGSNILAQKAKLVYGVDISIDAINNAKFKYLKANLVFLVGEAINIPLPDSSIDIFVSFETIEHHDQHQSMFKEIKRVLKPNGLLIISSPDKYYYSDLPGFTNQYHIKELYYDEFKRLIMSNFKYYKFFIQNIFIGSLIALDGNDIDYKVPITITENGETRSFTPLYNIAIASNSSLIGIRHQIIMYYFKNGIMITQNDIDTIKNKIFNSMTWRIGNLLIKPFKFLKKIKSNS